ncbi:MAG: FCD domain-containing protein [Tomitella sp.]|nr:FCD domain-containing protein [Tomitella sp.]
MQSIKKLGLVGQVTEQLRTEIESGRWQVGSRIPTEPVLAEMAGTGRNTVREAVQALVHAGLLDRRQGSGTYVMTDSAVSAALRREIDTAGRRELLELRQALEVTAARLAARRRNESDLESMRALLVEIERNHAAGDLAGAARADAELHRALVVAAHNTTYLRVYEGVVPSVELDMVTEIAHAGTVFPHEHTALVEAVEAGDADLAATTMFEFLSSLLEREVGPGPA